MAPILAVSASGAQVGHAARSRLRAEPATRPLAEDLGGSEHDDSVEGVVDALAQVDRPLHHRPRLFRCLAGVLDGLLEFTRGDRGIIRCHRQDCSTLDH